MTSWPYPVVDRYPLPPRQGFWESPRKRLRNVPRERGDLAVFLDVHGSYERVPDGQPLSKATSISSASAVVRVNIGTRMFTIENALACQGNLEDRTVTVKYRCKVDEPSEVLRSGLIDFVGELKAWTRATLRHLSTQFSPSDAEAFQGQAALQVERSLANKPPIPAAAINVELVDLEVTRPIDSIEHKSDRVAKMRAHENRLLDLTQDEEYAKKRQPLAKLHHKNDAEIRGLRAEEWRKAYQGGITAVLALSVAENPEDLHKLIEQGLAEQEQLTQVIRETIKSGVIPPNVEDSLIETLNQLGRTPEALAGVPTHGLRLGSRQATALPGGRPTLDEDREFVERSEGLPTTEDSGST